MNENKNNKLLYDKEEINRKKIENIYRNQRPYEDEEDDVDEETNNDNDENNDELENAGFENAEGQQPVNNSKASKINSLVQKGLDGINKVKKAKNLAKIGAFLAANWPIVIPAAGIIVIVIFFALISGTSVNADYSGNGSTTGLYGYDYLNLETMCEEVYVYNTPKGNDGTYTLEEYVAGIVNAEVGGMNDLITYETLAIAARTYFLVIAQRDGCQIEGTSVQQSFIPTDNELILKAVENTKGLVLTRDNNIFLTQYDAFCWDEKDDDYYYLCQGNYDTGESLKIPVEWAQKYVAAYSGSAFLTNSRYQAHGNGLSQDGTNYLSTVENWSKEEILSYFYGSDTKIMSIYQTFTYNGEYAINPDDELYQGLKLLVGTSLSDLLSSNGTSIEEYNSYLASVVENEGVGTRGAVVGSAITLIGSLANMGYKLSYQWGGKYNYIGVNQNWGLENGASSIEYWCNNYAEHYPEKSTCTTNYRWISFDCSGFVNWAIMNGFRYGSYDEMSAAGAYQYTNDNAYTVVLNENEAVCMPGDVLYKSSHIKLIVGLDDVNKRYIMAESTGSRIASNHGGVILSYESYGSTEYKCRSLEYLYSKYSGGQDED